MNTQTNASLRSSTWWFQIIRFLSWPWSTVLLLLGMVVFSNLNAQTLGEAMDTTGLAWSTGGNPQTTNGVWHGTTADSHDGVDAAMSLMEVNSYFYLSSWMQTTVQGPATVTFWGKCSGYIFYGFSAFWMQVDSVGAWATGASGEWTQAAVTIGSGSHTLTWSVFVNPDSQSQWPAGGTIYAYVDELNVAPITTPEIVEQPAGRTNDLGTSATFQVLAYGADPLTYQWRLYGTNLLGATNSSYTITNVQPEHAGTYSVVVTNTYGSITSSNATLKVRTEPVITQQPQAVTVNASANASFSVSANGAVPFQYQWRLAGTNIAGATNNPYVITNVQPQQAGLCSVVVSNAYGFTISSDALLTVRTVPTIFTQPQSSSVTQWRSSSFSVSVLGPAPFYYQWRFNGINLVGATNSTYTIAVTQTNQAGLYSVAITNAYGGVISSDALLTVIPLVASPSLGEALDAPSLFWATGGDNNWTVQTTVTHDGVDAAQDYQSSPGILAWLTTAVNGPGRLSFYYQIQNQSGPFGTTWGVIKLYVDAQPVESLDVSGWQFREIVLAPGFHVLRWDFSRLDSVFYPGASSTAWMDQVSFVPDTPVPPTIQTTGGSFGFGTNGFGFNLTGTTGQIVVVEASSNLVNWTPIWTNPLTAGQAYFSDPYSTNLIQRFYRAGSMR
jgi:hypothetical protein